MTSILATVRNLFDGVPSKAKDGVREALQDGRSIQSALARFNELTYLYDLGSEQKKVLYRIALETQIERTQKVYRLFKTVFVAFQEAMKEHQSRWTSDLEANPPKTLSQAWQFIDAHPIPTLDLPEEVSEKVAREYLRVFMHPASFAIEKEYLIREKKRLDEVNAACQELGVFQEFQIEPLEKSIIYKTPDEIRSIVQYRSDLGKIRETFEKRADVCRARTLWQEMSLETIMSELDSSESPTSPLEKCETLENLLYEFQDERAQLAQFASEVPWSREFALPDVLEVIEVRDRYVASHPQPQAIPPAACCTLQ